MGTNYYLLGPTCPHCGRGDDLLHIGKSSVGWCFALRVYPERGINSLNDWMPHWMSGEIYDEYQQHVTIEEMLNTVRNRRNHSSPPSANWLRENDAELGPNNLARSRIGRHCIGHGQGTWDLIEGEFS